ncbi:MAG: hypothetical protein EBY17_30840 [Acidobacteriia bacterium]|nr:hypothetical protein [Terriglobia bacterium]
MTLLQKLDRIPPFLCIAIGTGRKDGPSMLELAESTGIPIRTLERISSRTTWARIRTDTIGQISLHCSVDLIDVGPTMRYLKKTISSRSPLPNLKPIQRMAFNRRFIQWKSSQLKPASPAPASAPVKG